MLRYLILLIVVFLVSGQTFSEDRVGQKLSKDEASVPMVNGIPAVKDDVAGVWYATVDAERYRKNDIKIERADGDETPIVLTTLPLVVLQVPHINAMNNYIYMPGTLRIIDPMGRTGGKTDYETTIGTHYRGSSSLWYDKHNFALWLRTEDGKDADESLFGIRKDSKWILSAMAVDVSRLRDELCFQLWNEVSPLRDDDMIRNGTKGEYVEVLLNGQYNGIYRLTDKVNRKLLGLKKMQTNIDGSTTYRGLLYKCSRTADATHFLQLPDGYDFDGAGVSWGDWDLDYPDDAPSDAAWQPLWDVLTMISEHQDDLHEADIENVFYTEPLYSYALFALATGLRDNLAHNLFLSRKSEKDPRLWLTPWDLDASLGRDGSSAKLDFPMFDLNELCCEPYRSLLQTSQEEMRKRLASLWEEWKNGAFSMRSVVERINELCEKMTLSGAWNREFARWNGVNKFLGAEPIMLPEKLDEEKDYILQWYAKSFSWISDMLADHEKDALRSVEMGRKAPEGIYTLGGQRLFSAPDHGVFISGGRVVVK